MNPPTYLTPQQRRALLYKAATLVAQLEPLAQALATESFTPVEREGFRDLAGKGRVFALAEELRPLCSAEAHVLHRARAAGVALTVINTRTGRTTTKTFLQVRPAQTNRRNK